MKRSLFVAPILAFALALGATAWAGSSDYYSSTYWQAGQGASSSFSSSWWRSIMTKNASFDSTVTFIDNTSYSWHATLRGTGTFLATHWFSPRVKKAHCRANVAASVPASCTAVN